MKKLYFLSIVFSLTVNAKHLTIISSNFEINFKKSGAIFINTCALNVTVGGTLDVPTSVFFVNVELLNGTAPYTYLIDENPSPNGNLFYASNLSPGTHIVNVEDANGCKGSATFYATGLSKSDFNLPNFKCYPNPVKNLVTISNTTIIDEIKLISINGETLLLKQINSLNSELNVSNFSKGIYFLKIKTEGIEKIIKLIKD